MNLIRSIIFNILFYGGTCVVTILGLPSLLVSQVAVHRVRTIWVNMTLWLLRHVMAMDVRITGRENIPDGPVLVACKHQSAWETIALNMLFPDASFVLKKELLKLPIFGLYLQKAGNVPVDRAGGAEALRNMVATAKAVSQTGRPVIIFPQGTRVAPGDDAPYHPGVAALYGALSVPVVPIALNSGVFWGRTAFLKKSGTVEVKILPVIEPGMRRRDFMDKLKSEIETESDRLANLRGVDAI